MSDVKHTDHINEWAGGERTPLQVLDSINPDDIDMLTICCYRKDGGLLLASTDYNVDVLVTLLERIKLELLTT